MPENQVFGQPVGGGHNRAAEVLHITQPTLSRQLSQLEDGMGVRLFHRGAKKITLTSEGMLLRRRAEEILALVDRTAQELMEQEELVDGRIVIGGGELAAMQALPEMIESFRENIRALHSIFLREVRIWPKNILPVICLQMQR